MNPDPEGMAAVDINKELSCRGKGKRENASIKDKVPIYLLRRILRITSITQT